MPQEIEKFDLDFHNVVHPQDFSMDDAVSSEGGLLASSCNQGKTTSPPLL